MIKKVIYATVCVCICICFLYCFPTMNINLKMYIGLLLMGAFIICRPGDRKN